MSDEIFQEVIKRLEQLGELVSQGAVEGWGILVLQQRLYGLGWMLFGILLLVLSILAAKRWAWVGVNETRAMYEQAMERWLTYPQEEERRVNEKFNEAVEELGPEPSKDDSREYDAWKHRFNALVHERERARDRVGSRYDHGPRNWTHTEDGLQQALRTQIKESAALQTGFLIVGPILAAFPFWVGMLRMINPRFYALEMILRTFS